MALICKRLNYVQKFKGGANYILFLAFSTLCLFGCSDDGDTPECRQDSDCASRTDGKTTCDVKNEVCVAPTANTPECTSDAQCAGRTDGKTTCDVENEVCVAPTANTPECATDAQCAGRTDGKTTCDVPNQVCIAPQVQTCGEHEVKSAAGCICNNQENYYGNAPDCRLCAGAGTMLVGNNCICDAAANWTGDAASGCVCDNNGVIFDGKCVKIGDEITFGRYEQNCDSSDGDDPMNPKKPMKSMPRMLQNMARSIMMVFGAIIMILPVTGLIIAHSLVSDPPCG